MSKFYYRDKSGRGWNARVGKTNLLKIVEPGEIDWFDKEIVDFCDNADVGDTWENEIAEIIRTL